MGEEVPQLFSPQRTKLLFRMLQDNKNSTRIYRKPMPLDVKLDFAKKSKEYHAFKQVEKTDVEKELAAQLQVQLKAIDSIFFLPDYLMEECLGEDGEMREEDTREYEPYIMYIDQLQRLFPREITAKWRVMPAFEETLMRYEETRAQESQAQE